MIHIHFEREVHITCNLINKLERLRGEKLNYKSDAKEI